MRIPSHRKTAREKLTATPARLMSSLMMRRFRTPKDTPNECRELFHAPV
jgi:hypothetical protein